jgi:hypothetical protein
MIESRIRKIFRRWLKNNIDRFNYKPYAVNSMCDKYYFEGITKHVTLVLDYRLPEAMLYHHKECCNHDVIQYIGYEKYDPKKGYYDADRVDDTGEPYPEGHEIFKYYPTQEELYISEVFEPIIDFVNHKLVRENQIYVLKGYCSCSSKIALIADYEETKKRFGGSGFTISLACLSSGEKEKKENVLYVYDLFEVSYGGIIG